MQKKLNIFSEYNLSPIKFNPSKNQNQDSKHQN